MWSVTGSWLPTSPVSVPAPRPAEERLGHLEHATGVLAVTVANQDTPAPWIPAQRDGSSR